MALWVVPNIEHYEYLPPVRAAIRGRARPHPDVLGYGMRDYGNRVGLWRMFDVMDKLRHPLHDLAQSRGVRTLSGDPGGMRSAALGRDGARPLQHPLSLEHGGGRRARRDRRMRGVLSAPTGRQLAGWFSPAATFTLNTPDLVAEAGIKYYCDWYHDDQPFPIRSAQAEG